MKRNSIYKYLLFTFSIFAFFFVRVEAATTITKTKDIYYGQTAHIISGTEFSGVQCSYSGDTDKFNITRTENSDNWYVGVKDSSTENGSVNFHCTYMHRYAISDGNRRYVDSDGTLDYTISISGAVNHINEIEIYLDKQFIKSVDMAGYLSQKAATGVESFRLSDNFSILFDNLNVPCNGNSCLLTLKDNAEAKTVQGQLYYGTHTMDFIVHVSEEWMVHASSAYGSCDFNPPSDPDRWSKRDNSNWYYAYFNINNESIVLPSCTADSSTGNAYLALDFVGWTYAKDSKTDSNVSPNMYQSVGSCSLFFKDSYTPEEQAMYPNMSTAKQYVGAIHAGQALKPENMTFDGSANSAFYACYKRTGIAFNLNGATVEDNTAIMDWATYNGVYYRTQSELNSPTFVLPTKVKPSALKSDYKFIGWDNGLLGYNGTNPEVLLTGGTSVSTDSGYIYSPIFVREQTGQSYITKTVYSSGKASFTAPDGFSCYSARNDYFTVTPSNGECIIAGIKSTNGEYKDYVMNSGAKTFIVKIGVVSVTGSEEVIKKPIQIGDGEIIIGGDNGEGNAAVSLPNDCDKYFVGSSNIKSNDLFDFRPALGSSSERITVTTYFAKSMCDNVEYAALCIDPGRSGPTRGTGTTTIDGHFGQYYSFHSYLSFNERDTAHIKYREFNVAVANIISKLGVVPLETFKEANNPEKIAANMAIRIVTIHTNYAVSADSAGAFDGQNTYAANFQVYQSMAQHIGENLGQNNIAVRPSDGKSCTDAGVNGGLYLSCNAEWQGWQGNEAMESVFTLLADYLSYADFDVDTMDDSEPEVSVTSSNEDETLEVGDSSSYTASIKFPNSSVSPIYKDPQNPNSALSGIGIYMSKKVRDYFDIQFSGYNSNKVNKKETEAGTYYEFEFTYTSNDPSLDYKEYRISFTITPKPINGKMEWPVPNTRDMAFYVTYKAPFSKQNAFIVVPTENESSVQRMLLFNSESAIKWTSLNVINCNTLLANYGNDESYYDLIYQAGCCESVVENGTYADFYSKRCKSDCVANTFIPVCTFNEECILKKNALNADPNDDSICTPTSGKTNLEYKIKEGTTKAGKTEYRCIVNTDSFSAIGLEHQAAIMMGGAASSNGLRDTHPMDITSNMKDVTGENSIAVQSFNNNPYCRVNCKEEWTFNMPGFYNFIGGNAVKAGSLFQIDNPIILTSETTCVTTYISIESYTNSVNRLSQNIVSAYNSYSERAAAHQDLVETQSSQDYNWYDVSYEQKSCGADQLKTSNRITGCGVSGDIYRKCSDESEYNAHSVCRSGNYNIDCSKGDSDHDGCTVSGSYSKSCQSESDGEDCEKVPIAGPGFSYCVAAGGGDNCYTITGTYDVSCEKNDSNHDGCTVTGEYSVPCTSGTLSETGCSIADAWYDSGSDCQISTLVQSTGKIPSNTTEYDYSRCGYTGNYWKFTQTSHIDSTNSGACRIYTVSPGANSTTYNKWQYNGTAASTTNHGATNIAQTRFTAGTNTCGATSQGTVNCDKPVNHAYTDGDCEVTHDKTNANWWYEYLKNNRIKYIGSGTPYTSYYDFAASTTIRGQMKSYYNSLYSSKELLDKFADAFAKCQNYYINNTSDTSASKKTLTSIYGTQNAVYSNEGGIKSSITTVPLSIDTKFDPAGTFGYDDEYMNQIDVGAGKNVIGRISGITSSATAEGYSRGEMGGYSYLPGTVLTYYYANVFPMQYDDNGSGNNGTYTGSFALNGVYGAANSKLKSHDRTICIIKSNLGGGSDFDYTGTGVEVFCSPTHFYYYDVDYIKKSLSSSANFANKATWYRKNNGSIISVGYDFAGQNAFYSALDNARLSRTTESINDWSVLGNYNANVFPIALTTKRNMYQYYYSFKGIGNYIGGHTDTSRNGIGRIMGYEDSVVENNARVCFYEVYESICICCGSESASYLVSNTTKIDSSSHMVSNGYYYGMSSMYIEGSGQLGFNTTTVSLYSLNNASKDVLGANWKKNDKFFYNGNTYTTNKGAELATEIQEVGENVYTQIPEYSYTLTPDAMAHIRQYNEGKTYGVASGSLYSINDSDQQYAYLAKKSGVSFVVNDGNTYNQIKFSHYGSVFLRDYINTYETAEYKKDLFTNKKMTANCYVTRASDIYDNPSRYKDCKWIDYVQGDYRLAFK
ncbi:MAG: hypothetical protein IJ475_00140 [Bacilli bacterium]|nr:hypothetical protein [Bacilli bacterium]